MEQTKLQVPNFSIFENAVRQESCSDPNNLCTDCCAIHSDPNCRANFGLDLAPVNITPNCECHDISVEEVRLICAQNISCTFNFPGTGNCRLGPRTACCCPPTFPPSGVAEVFITAASEELAPDCQGVNVAVDLLVVHPNISCPQIIMPVGITRTCNTFFRFPPIGTGCNDPVNVVGPNELPNELKEIDGSSLLIQVAAEFFNDPVNGRHLDITGKIVDKLWKHENLWVTGLRPYEITDVQRNAGFVSITVSNDFTGHQIPAAPQGCF
ncbi:MAG TPA: hypothetical protein PKA28_06300 [Methylomusa anaerophila]|uniref:Uncharacterized protein n=1 Tax=Methylomusa anaerophila TaxID=1930071 RepID=A0A348ALJ5_9FIRM|nr:hypothetical protein [Methylomusa anaerophila]BBB91943.1 hypothetical protein MAMMFC1_02628 [Methylomusa anaerophila]HML88045.1 hypothetical protein [Methylomusa anaerophila]